MTEAEMRAAVRDVLRSLNAVAEAAIRRELAGPIDLGHSDRLQFEACPHFFGVKLPAWLADRWQAVGGPGSYRPAYLLFHGGLDEPRYDLEQRRWCELSEVWPEEA